MLRNSLVLIVCLFFYCCDNGSDSKTIKKEAATISKPKKKATVKKKNVPDLINNKNVNERLMKYGEENPETIVLFYTNMGKIKARLYKDTPLHRANFILLSKKGYFNGSIFSRVVKNFVAQVGGSYNDEQIAIKKKIGFYTLPPEIKPHHFHKKGTLAAARKYIDNPEKRSAMDEFYFVEGSVFNEPTLEKYEEENHFKYTQTQKNYYLNHPGAAHLDGQHTVFGEIIQGLPVVAKLTNVATGSRDWPLEDIYIEKVEVLK